MWWRLMYDNDSWSSSWMDEGYQWWWDTTMWKKVVDTWLRLMGEGMVLLHGWWWILLIDVVDGVPHYGWGLMKMMKINEDDKTWLRLMKIESRHGTTMCERINTLMWVCEMKAEGKINSLFGIAWLKKAVQSFALRTASKDGSQHKFINKVRKMMADWRWRCRWWCWCWCWRVDRDR